MPLADALAHAFLGLHEASALQAMVTAQARRCQPGWDYRMRLGSLEAVSRMVALGAGVAVMPRAVAEREARASGLLRVPLTDGWAARTLLLAAPSFGALPPATARLAKFLIDATSGAVAPERR